MFGSMPRDKVLYAASGEPAQTSANEGTAMATTAKIDTHQHFFPKPYVEAIGMDALAAQMPNRKAPEWSPERAIAMMDVHGIEEGILSVSSVPAAANSPRLLHGCNE